MLNDPLPFAMLATATFLIAGFVKGVVGLGLPTVAVGLLSLAVPPAQAAALLVVPSLVTNVWQLASGPAFGPLLARLWPMLAAIVAGTWAGTLLFAGIDGRKATAAIGVALIVYALLALSPLRPRVRVGSERWLGPLAGAATGLITAPTGLFMIPAVPYLQALGLEKEDLVQALGLSFTVSTLALASGLAGTGLFEAKDALASLLALAPALAGMAAGQWARRRIPPATFRLCFLCGILLLGGNLALRG